MKKLIILFFLLANAVSFAQNIEGEWTPDNDSRLGNIRIKHVEDSKYKVRLETYEGVKTINATYRDGKLVGKYEQEPQYGKFWVEFAPDREWKIYAAAGSNTKESYGAVSGSLGNNSGYNKTNSRYNCATVEDNYCIVYLYFEGDSMTAYMQLRADYLKGDVPMFYQESGLGKGFKYTKW